VKVTVIKYFFVVYPVIQITCSSDSNILTKIITKLYLPFFLLPAVIKY